MNTDFMKSEVRVFFIETLADLLFIEKIIHIINFSSPY